MKKEKAYKIIIIFGTILLFVASTLLYKYCYIPYKENTKMIENFKNNEPLDFNKDIDNFKIENEKKEFLNSMPTKNNDVLNGTKWLDSESGSLIVFEENYFIWYLDDKVSSENAMFGQFSYYEGEKAFNLLKENTKDLERTKNDTVLILTIRSYKINNKETLEEEQVKYLFGYGAEKIKNFIDISTYQKHSLIKIDENL